jgi:hypothetical protein
VPGQRDAVEPPEGIERSESACGPQIVLGAATADSVETLVSGARCW